MNRAQLLGRARRLLDPQFVAAAAVALVVEVGLATSTLPRIARLLGIRLARDGEPRSAAPLADRPPTWVRRRYTEVHRVYGHWPFGDTCLRRALVLGQRLRRLDPVLVIGVRHDEQGRVAAPAWLVVGGIVFDPLAGQFAPLRTVTGG